MGKVHGSGLAQSPWYHSSEPDFWAQLRQRALALHQTSDRALVVAAAEYDLLKANHAEKNRVGASGCFGPDGNIDIQFRFWNITLVTFSVQFKVKRECHFVA